MPASESSSAARNDAELALLRRYREDGDDRARDQLVELMMPWVRRIASRYARRGQETDDLVQVGSVGLIKAIDRYDFDRGVRLTTFAEPNVTGEIKRHFRDHGWNIRPPRDLQELNADVMRAIDALSADLQRSPAISEVAAFMDVSEEQVIEALQAGAVYDAEPLIVSDEEGGEHESTATAEDEAGIELTEVRQDLGRAFEDLDERQRRVIYLRFYRDLTQSEIAEQLGVSQMQVSRILRAALAAIRDGMER